MARGGVYLTTAIVVALLLTAEVVDGRALLQDDTEEAGAAPEVVDSTAKSTAEKDEGVASRQELLNEHAGVMDIVSLKEAEALQNKLAERVTMLKSGYVDHSGKAKKSFFCFADNLRLKIFGLERAIKSAKAPAEGGDEDDGSDVIIRQKERLAVAYKKCLGEVYHEGDCNEFRARKYLGDAVEAMQKRFQRVSELDRSHSSFKTAEMLYKHAHNQYMHVHECVSIIMPNILATPKIDGLDVWLGQPEKE